eukprot:g34589.t1
MSTVKLRDELYCIERKIQTGRKNLFKKKEMLETVLKAGKAGRGGPHIYTDPKVCTTNFLAVQRFLVLLRKTTIHCVSKEEKDARGNVYTTWLKVENDCNLFQDHWVVFVDKLQLEKAEERESKKREILSRADPARYSAAMKEKVQQFLHLKSFWEKKALLILGSALYDRSLHKCDLLTPCPVMSTLLQTLPTLAAQTVTIESCI